MHELERLRQAIGKALTLDRQIFVSANLGNFIAFCESERGKAAIAAFVKVWENKPPPE